MSDRPLCGHTEVTNLEVAAKIDEDIGRLQIEVDVIRIVDVLDTLDDHVSIGRGKRENFTHIA